jgi:dTDP-4-amino-4,6-dideoxygalactose transaminase
VFCDITMDGYTMDADKIENLINENTSAILPVHVYGNLCDVGRIGEIAERHGLVVIYDAAHAFGVRFGGAGAAGFGDASMFSFHATKCFHTVEGGAAAVKRRAVFDRLEAMKNHGLAADGHAEAPGTNGKLSEFHAAMGLCNMRRLSGETEKRRAAAERYRDRLSGLPGLTLNRQRAGATENYAYFPVLLDGVAFGAAREQVCEALAAQGIFPRKYFWPAMNESGYCKGKRGGAETPVARYVSERVLALPMHAGLSLADVDRVCDALLGLAGGRG